LISFHRDVMSSHGENRHTYTKTELLARVISDSAKPTYQFSAYSPVGLSYLSLCR
jgi:hypothetical protein